MKKEDCPVSYGECKYCDFYRENTCKHSELPNFCFCCGTALEEGKYYCSKECKEKQEEENRKERERAEEEHKKEQKILSDIETSFGKNIIKQIEEEMKESEGGWNLEIVDKPKGESEGDLLDGREVWINQTCNGGYTGDDFAGEVYFKLPNNKWLKWDYSM